jgi:hypothetical protein
VGPAAGLGGTAGEMTHTSSTTEANFAEKNKPTRRESPALHAAPS